MIAASDGSRQARVAVRAAAEFPWPANADGMGLVARDARLLEWSPSVSLAIDAEVRRVADATRDTLRRRWRNASVVIADDAAVDAIVQRTRGAGAVVLGSHGHSQLERWVLGSVSQAVVRRARSPVLVVKGDRLAVRHVVIGYDGSRHAKRAIDLVAKLAVPRKGRVTMLGFFDPVTSPTMALLPSRVRAVLAGEARELAAERKVKLERQLARAAARLERAGWDVRVEARAGIAARDLVGVPVELGADLVVIGAQGVGGLRRIVLGSVAVAVIDRSPLSVLVVR